MHPSSSHRRPFGLRWAAISQPTAASQRCPNISNLLQVIRPKPHRWAASPTAYVLIHAACDAYRDLSDWPWVRKTGRCELLGSWRSETGHPYWAKDKNLAF
jgi:hypothetical protein